MTTLSNFKYVSNEIDKNYLAYDEIQKCMSLY
jgi:hypothetical protein